MSNLENGNSNELIKTIKAISNHASNNLNKSNENQAKGRSLNFLSGSLTSILLAWLSLKLSQEAIKYFFYHPSTSSSIIAINIAKALKTLAIGMTFLATFSFTFIGFGLFLVFIRSLLPSDKRDSC
uniref:DUF3082 domain-containing protein n=1 Tax=Paulinella chromatophora TaxID=39717 RepID=B1X422_PAUCH|nr:hypothetical protein PCC_0242 [Paulinella chromatophora]ACB42691.1 hypothetical protein PCC_0242 [Paulinella chromatophora]